MNMKKILTFLAALVVFSLPVFATNDASVTRIIDEKDYMLFKIDGTADPNTDVLVFLYKKGVNPGSIELDSLKSTVLGFERLKTSELGNYTVTFVMENDEYNENETGNYAFGVSFSDGGVLSYYNFSDKGGAFSYVERALRNEAMERVRACTPNDNTSIHNIIAADGETLLLDSDVLGKYQSDSDLSAFVDAALSVNPSAYRTNKAFKEAFEEANILYIIQAAKADELEEIIARYKNIIGINNDIILLHPEYAEKSYERISKKTFSSVEALNKVIRDAVISECAQNCIRWGELQELMFVNYASDIIIDNETYGIYDALKTKSNVFTEVLNNKPYDSIEDLTNKFKTAVTNEQIRERKEQAGEIDKGNYGGGGGKGVSSVSFSKPAAENETEKTGAERFTDIGNYTWAYNAIDALTKKEIINGVSDDCFAPEKNITRAEFIKMLVNTVGLKFTGKDRGFGDVAETDWYYPYVCVACDYNITDGIGRNLFAPNDNISRQDMSVMIYRAVSVTNKALQESDSADFSDYSEISDYAKQAVSVLTKNKIVNGFENSFFKPQEYATRAQAAVMLYKLMCI